MKSAVAILVVVAVVAFNSSETDARYDWERQGRGMALDSSSAPFGESFQSLDNVRDEENDGEDDDGIEGSDDEELDEVEDACNHLSCGAGRECDPESGRCVCVRDCGYDPDPRRQMDLQVCSNHNETFATDCNLFRARCLCEDDLPGCSDRDKSLTAHVEYYGECRPLPSCSSEELEDFPRRMREWLFNVMQEMSEREELSEHYLDMEKEAEESEDQSVRWRNAAVWKWCDLDGSPSDAAVSRHELFPIRAPLRALEHCIGDFLDGCDADSDRQVTLEEWGRCLNLEEGDMKARCDSIHKSKRDQY